MADSWMRILRVELISTKLKSKLVIGDKPEENLAMTISGSKYPAMLKDKGVISIMNLDYSTILKIQLGEYYKIKIFAGYKGSNLGNPGCGFELFNGSVAYISVKIKSRYDWETYINFASDVVAQYSQNRMNLAFNSSINVFTAIDYVCGASGMKSYTIDPDLKKQFINQVNEYHDKAATILDSVTMNEGTYLISSDGTDGNVVDVTSTRGKRIIKLNAELLPIINGNPTVSSDGLSITLLPLLNFKVGDIIEIPNSIIDISSNSAEAYNNGFNANYLDKNGRYMILEINYTLGNRSETYQYQIKGRALSIIQQFEV